jgi:16S rRNA (guanine527-N7)-methyltransferase
MTQEEMGGLLAPYLEGAAVPEELYGQLRTYLELLTKWNARTNLTAIREPAEMVRRHFGESLFAARQLPECDSLLDFGSGAGFPGLPMQLWRPELGVTLAESQNKKATFLREVCRTLGLDAGQGAKTEVWAARVEGMAAGRQFDVVAMRAVDHMEVALEAARVRTREWLVVLTTERAWVPQDGFAVAAMTPLPGSADGVVVVARRG